MKWFSTYNPDTGEITSNFLVDASLAQANTPQGSVLVEGCHSPEDGFFSAGQFVPYTEAQALTKRERPAHPCRWDNTAMAWVDLRNLARHKQDRWDEIKAKRSRLEYAGFTWDGSVFDSDPVSQSRIQGAVQLAGLDPVAFSIDWTLADNTVRTLSGADMVAVGVALAQHVNGLHVVARGLRTQIESATTIAEVEAVVWPG